MNTFEFYKEQEKQFVFTRFLHSDALKLGDFLSKLAVENNYPVAIEIEINGDCIFRYMNDGAAQSNFEWIKKKANVVKRFQMSSAAFAAKLEKKNVKFSDVYGSDLDYAATAGAFPIRIENVGTIGVVGVSGLDSDSDHELIIKGLKKLSDERK